MERSFENFMGPPFVQKFNSKTFSVSAFAIEILQVVRHDTSTYPQ